MKAPINWLKQYVDIDMPAAELAHRLTMAGAEVDAIEAVGGWEGIVVGEVIAVEPHPNADKLKLVTVDIATAEITVVCGAPNVAVGQKVPFASVGAELIDPHSGQRSKLKKAKIRGVVSEGMVCSECELGISDNHEGIMVLPTDTPCGTPLDRLMADVVFDFSITPNRPDLLSIIGIAREVAALTGKTLELPDLSYEESAEPAAGRASVEIIDPDLCPRYCASIITGVKMGPSPSWMQQRLAACGMRPINNVVDITNYVMLEFGQPLHAFDYDNIADRKIIVRRARKETMRTLDGASRALSDDMLVIADGMGPVAVAGVMGGAESEVTDATTSILLESANFNPASIRRTSAAFKLRSEASLRFEKGVSPELPVPALKRATQLMAQLCGGRVARGIIDVYPGRKAIEPLPLTANKVRRVIGSDISIDEAKSVLESLGLKCERDGADAIKVTVPYWRTDISVAEDLVEEVARITGYDSIPTTIPSGQLPAYKPERMRDLVQRISDLLVGCGMQEVITYSLISRDAMKKADLETVALKVANPITIEQEYLRTSLRPGLLMTLAYNQRFEEGGLKLFEVDKIYMPREGDLPHEKRMLACVLCGDRNATFWQQANGKVDFFDAKGIVETVIGRLGLQAMFSPASDKLLIAGRTASIHIRDTIVGVVGELHPRIAERFDIRSRPVYLFEIDMEQLLPLTSVTPKYNPLPRFPATMRDIALIIDIDTPSDRLVNIIQGSPLVSRVTLFDVYTGEQVPKGKKSLAFRIEYQTPERTLTDEEVDREQQKLLDSLSKEFGATLRG